MLNIVKKKFVIELSYIEMVLFAFAGGIILQYGYVAFVAMTQGNGVVLNDFNRYGEGWFEMITMFGIAEYLFAQIFRSKEI